MTVVYMNAYDTRCVTRALVTLYNFVNLRLKYSISYCLSQNRENPTQLANILNLYINIRTTLHNIFLLPMYWVCQLGEDIRNNSTFMVLFVDRLKRVSWRRINIFWEWEQVKSRDWADAAVNTLYWLVFKPLSTSTFFN